jgi:hypothetical protein
MVIRARMGLGDTLRGQGAFGQAEPLLLAAATAFRERRAFGKDPYNFALGALAQLYDAQGRKAEAAKYRALIER